MEPSKANPSSCDHVIGLIGANQGVKASEWNAAITELAVKIKDFNERGQRYQVNHPGFVSQYHFCANCGKRIDGEALGLLSLNDASERLL